MDMDKWMSLGKRLATTQAEAAGKEEEDLAGEVEHNQNARLHKSTSRIQRRSGCYKAQVKHSRKI